MYPGFLTQKVYRSCYLFCQSPWQQAAALSRMIRERHEIPTTLTTCKSSRSTRNNSLQIIIPPMITRGVAWALSVHIHKQQGSRFHSSDFYYFVWSFYWKKQRGWRNCSCAQYWPFRSVYYILRWVKHFPIWILVCMEIKLIKINLSIERNNVGSFKIQLNLYSIQPMSQQKITKYFVTTHNQKT